MLKKLLSFFLALLLILSLAACGNEDTEETKRKRSSKKETTEVTDVTDDTEDEVGEPEKDRTKNYKSPYTEFEEMDDTVIIDDEYVKVTIHMPEPEDWFLEFEVDVENKYDHTIAVYADEAAINGIMTGDGFYVAAEADADATDVGHIYNITDFEDVTRFTMAVHVYDTEYYEFDEIHYIDIYPHGKDAYEEEKAPEELEVLFDEDGLFCSVIEYYIDDMDDYRVAFVAGNYTEEVVIFTPDIATVNGFGYVSDGYVKVLPGTVAIGTNYLDTEYLDVLGIEEVTALEWDCSVSNLEYDELLNETVTIYPEGKKKAHQFEYEFDDEDDTAVSEDDFSMTMVHVTYEEDYVTRIYFILENDTDVPLSAEGSNLVINGKKLVYNGLFITSYRSVDTFGVISIYYEDLEDLEIDQIKSVQMDLEVYDDDYDTVFEDTVTFKFNL